MIKFRAWHRDNKTMVYFDPMKLVTDQYQRLALVTLMSEDSDLLMRYVGLTDKTGKEIYEGDIFNCVYHSDGCTKHKLVVRYSDQQARFNLYSTGKCQQPFVDITMSDMCRKKIIGNIHVCETIEGL